MNLHNSKTKNGKRRTRDKSQTNTVTYTNNSLTNSTITRHLGNFGRFITLNIILSYIKITSIRNKLRNISVLLNISGDVSAISESKLNESIPGSQIKLLGYKKPYKHFMVPSLALFLTFI